ncbi:methyltransferase [Polaribacter sp. SA4-10]|uniref:O-methyltransferase n=1 Tax=Polaribacter sp. SA4-10 TaxID=754397 RepID=UPI000B3C5833|nr:class I SAM-dependent methyltransferase [Polaribacter sp. SA4-10]ARV05967.1 methyltransferase [Polaribacter sp. SA4-10]
MLNITIEYLTFLLKSTNQHGVHSPFSYKLITKCLYKKTTSSLWGKFKEIKQQLLDNKETVKVTDFGSGSKIFKNDERQISKIAKVAGISNKKAKLLIRLVDYFQPKNALEIGTSLGLSTSAIKLGNPNCKIVTLEGCPETSNVAQNLFKKNNFKNIQVISGEFKNTVPQSVKNEQFDFIYFDGNHNKKSTLEYFNSCLETINNDAIWIFDDIYWNSEMKEAWKEIKAHPKVTVTIDIFHWGIVFFRKEQAKEHFKIRV